MMLIIKLDYFLTNKAIALKQIGEMQSPLTRLYRAGELTPVWVPDKEQEAIRDLTRAREDMKSMGGHAKQRLGTFLLRHEKDFLGSANGHRRILDGWKR